MMQKLITVVEVPPFPARIKKLLEEDEQQEFINFIAQHPLQGEEIPDTGGLRKIRWKAQNRGKRGGLRVIYYYYNPDHPLFLLTAYTKNQQEDLTSDEKHLFKKFIDDWKRKLKQHD